MRVLWGLVLLVLAFPLRAEWFQRTEAIMGTRIHVELWQQDATIAKNLMQQVIDEMHRIDQLMSPYKDTAELAIINRDAAKHPVQVTPELFDLIELSNKFGDMSGGAFDITFASLGHQFDYRQQVKPDARQRQQATALINYKSLRLDAKNHTVFFPKPGMRIDLGGIAKGHAVDNAIRILKLAGVQHGIVTAGGDSRLIGDHMGRPWMLGIKHPRGESHVVSLPLENVALSTSGDYERYFEADGVRYHHIIDPKKGDSAREVVSATIIADDATTSDALSTTVFILGVQRGLELVNKMDNVSAILIDNAGKIHYSADLAAPP